jgi:hypothetical protein
VLPGNDSLPTTSRLTSDDHQSDETRNSTSVLDPHHQGTSQAPDCFSRRAPDLDRCGGSARVQIRPGFIALGSMQRWITLSCTDPNSRPIENERASTRSFPSLCASLRDRRDKFKDRCPSRCGWLRARGRLRIQDHKKGPRFLRRGDACAPEDT